MPTQDEKALVPQGERWFSTDEIAEVTGKRRDNVNAEWEAELAELGLSLKSQEKSGQWSHGDLSWTFHHEPSGGGRPMRVYRLNHFSALQYAARIDAQSRYRLVQYVAKTERAMREAVSLDDQMRPIIDGFRECLDTTRQIAAGQVEIRDEVNGLGRKVDSMQSEIRALPIQRKPWPDSVVARCYHTLAQFGNGKCPVSGVQLVDANGKPISNIHIDHWNQKPWDSVANNAFPCSAKVNERLKNPVFREECRPIFVAFQKQMGRVRVPRTKSKKRNGNGGNGVHGIRDLFEDEEEG